MEPIQIIAIVFAVFAFSRVLLRFKDRSMKKAEFILWSIVWIGVIVVAALPSTALFVSGLLGVQRAVDLLVYLSIIVLFYLCFKLYIKTEKLERSITKIVREVALREKK